MSLTKIEALFFLEKIKDLKLCTDIMWQDKDNLNDMSKAKNRADKLCSEIVNLLMDSVKK